MERPVRIVLVTLGLCLAGAVFGALAAVVAFALASGLTGGFDVVFYADVLAFVAAVGAVFGGVLLPVTCWVLLRRVPLGLAVMGTVAGTVLGGALGWMLLPDSIIHPVLGAVAGFFCAALLLRLRASAPRAPRGAAARAARQPTCSSTSAAYPQCLASRPRRP